MKSNFDDKFYTVYKKYKKKYLKLKNNILEGGNLTALTIFNAIKNSLKQMEQLNVSGTNNTWINNLSIIDKEINELNRVINKYNYLINLSILNDETKKTLNLSELISAKYIENLKDNDFSTYVNVYNSSGDTYKIYIQARITEYNNVKQFYENNININNIFNIMNDIKTSFNKINKINEKTKDEKTNDDDKSNLRTEFMNIYDQVNKLVNNKKAMFSKKIIDIYINEIKKNQIIELMNNLENFKNLTKQFSNWDILEQDTKNFLLNNIRDILKESPPPDFFKEKAKAIEEEKEKLVKETEEKEKKEREKLEQERFDKNDIFLSDNNENSYENDYHEFYNNVEKEKKKNKIEEEEKQKKKLEEEEEAKLLAKQLEEEVEIAKKEELEAIRAKEAEEEAAKKALEAAKKAQDAQIIEEEATRIALEAAKNVKEAIIAQQKAQTTEEEAAKKTQEALQQAKEEKEKHKKTKKVLDNKIKNNCNDDNINKFKLNDDITKCTINDEIELDNNYNKQFDYINNISIKDGDIKCKTLAENKLKQLKIKYDQCKKNIKNKKEIQLESNFDSDEIYQQVLESNIVQDTTTQNFSKDKNFSIKENNKFLIFDINKEKIDEYKKIDCKNLNNLTESDLKILKSFVREFSMFHQSKLSDEKKSEKVIISNDLFQEKIRLKLINNAYIITITKINKNSFTIVVRSVNNPIEKQKLIKIIDELIKSILKKDCYKIDYNIEKQINEDEDETLKKNYLELDKIYNEYKKIFEETKNNNQEQINTANKNLVQYLTNIKTKLNLENSFTIESNLNEEYDYSDIKTVLVGNKKLLELIKKKISDNVNINIDNSMIFKLSDKIDDSTYKYGEFINKFRPYSAHNKLYLLLDSAISKKRIIDLLKDTNKKI